MDGAMFRIRDWDSNLALEMVMARLEKRLSAIEVSKKSEPGMYPDGMGLYLLIGPSGAKSWVFRYRVRGGNGKRTEMGLGPLHSVSLADARLKAAEQRKLLVDGVDPVKSREKVIQDAKLEKSREMTFKQCAEAYIKANRAGWKNDKHAAQWTSTLKAYAYPLFGDAPVQSIDTALVMKALEPIWSTKTETASRVRGRVEAVLDWATVSTFRSGDNPARWKGHLDHLLPARSDVQTVRHHPALPYDQMGGFMADLRGMDSVSARGVEFAILTATRTIETRGALWSEFDLENKIWTIPPSRLKAGKKTGKEHRVPLTDEMLSIITKMDEIRQSKYVFPGGTTNKPLSDMALLSLVQGMGYKDAKGQPITVHGFRSSFRDWAAERTSFPNEVIEMSLAHTIGDKVEAAYRRGDLFDKRRKLMDAWDAFCASIPAKATANVASIRGLS